MHSMEISRRQTKITFLDYDEKNQILFFFGGNGTMLEQFINIWIVLTKL